MSRSAEDNDAPETPRAVSRDTERDLEPPARDSGPRETPRSVATTTLSEGTLLSVKATADRMSDGPDPKVDELERRLTQLEARLKVLELGRSEPGQSERRWLFWVGLLLALGLGWQLRAYLH